MKQALLTLIRLYQLAISVFFGPCCRFFPTCSAYSTEAIETYGVVRGLGMTAVRVSKCHPFHPGGLDPVPTDPQLSTVEEGV